jgi:hypothetical protein
MELNSPGEAGSFLASKEIHGILWKPEVHCRVHNSPLPFPVLSQSIPAHALLVCHSKAPF